LLFYCHRCGARGHIIKLLNYLGINPNKFFNPSFFHLNSQIYSEEKFSPEEKNKKIPIIKKSDYFLFLKNPDFFKDEINYVKKRTGIKNYFLFPTYGITIFEKNKIHFFNAPRRPYENHPKLILFRNLKKEKNKKIPKYFRLTTDENFELINLEKNNFLNLEKIFFSEGTFDTINLFRNLPVKIKGEKNYLFVSVQGSFYQSVFEKYFLKFPHTKEFHFFLDKDINERKLYFRIKNIIDRFTAARLITPTTKRKKIFFYKNPLFKDYGEIEKFGFKKIYEVEF
jgi:hypothetical protein